MRRGRPQKVADQIQRELAEVIREVVGFQGDIVFDPTKPDGTPRKLLDVAKVTKLGWRPRIALDEGLRRTYEWFVAHVAKPS